MEGKGGFPLSFVKECTCSNTEIKNEVITLISRQTNNLKFFHVLDYQEFFFLVSGKRGSIISGIVGKVKPFGVQ